MFVQFCCMSVMQSQKNNEQFMRDTLNIGNDEGTQASTIALENVTRNENK